MTGHDILVVFCRIWWSWHSDKVENLWDFDHHETNLWNSVPRPSQGPKECEALARYGKIVIMIIATHDQVTCPMMSHMAKHHHHWSFFFWGAETSNNWEHQCHTHLFKSINIYYTSTNYICLLLWDQFSFENGPIACFLVVSPAQPDWNEAIACQAKQKKQAYLASKAPTNECKSWVVRCLEIPQFWQVLVDISAQFGARWRTYKLYGTALYDQLPCPSGFLEKGGRKPFQAEGLPFQLPCLLPQLSLAHQSSQKQSLSLPTAPKIQRTAVLAITPKSNWLLPFEAKNEQFQIRNTIPAVRAASGFCFVHATMNVASLFFLRSKLCTSRSAGSSLVAFRFEDFGARS